MMNKMLTLKQGAKATGNVMSEADRGDAALGVLQHGLVQDLKSPANMDG